MVGPVAGERQIYHAVSLSVVFTKKRVKGRKERETERGRQRTNASSKEQRQESRSLTCFLMGQHTVFHAARQYVRHRE